MPSTFKNHGTVIMSVIAAITMLATAYLTRDSEYKNAWLYVFVVWCFLFAAFELYHNYKNKNKNQ